MSALALPTSIAPAKASAPQGSIGAADATGFKSLLSTCLEKDAAPVDAEKPEASPANDDGDAEAVATTGLLVAPAPIPAPVALPTAALETDMPAPTIASTGDAPLEVDPSSLLQPASAPPPAAPKADTALETAVSETPAPAASDVPAPRMPVPLTSDAPAPQTPAPVALNTPKLKVSAPVAPEALPTMTPAPVAPGASEPKTPTLASSDVPASRASTVVASNTPAPKAALPPAPVPAAPIIPAARPATAETTETRDSAAETAGAPPADSAPTPAPAPQPAPAPMRALAERTSRPLDLPAQTTDGAAASGANTADARAGATSASPASGSQSIVDPTARPFETAPTAATDITAVSDQPAIDAAPVAEHTTGSASTAAHVRETSLSGLSRATIDATAQIAAQILRKLEGRSTRFEMALTPDDLGRVDVKLDIDSEGRLAARLAFDNPAAATDLRGRVDDLRRELEDAGFHMADDAFEFADRDSGSSSFDRGQDARQGQNRAFAAAARLNAEIDVAQPPRWMALSLSPSGVDLKV